MEHSWAIIHTRNIHCVIALVHIWASRGNEVAIQTIPHHFAEKIAHMVRDPCAAHLIEKACLLFSEC